MNANITLALTAYITACANGARFPSTAAYGRTLGFELGKRYAKVFAVDTSFSRSVVAFVDMATGDIYKPASWKGPAKGVRGNVMTFAHTTTVKLDLVEVA